MDQKYYAEWAKKVLTGSWLYDVKGDLVLPADVKYEWAFCSSYCTLVPALLYATPKKVVYRISCPLGTVDVAVPRSSIQVINWPE
jgi:hypothetical protein